MSRSYLLLFLMLGILASCEKKEEAIVLPKVGPASHDSVVMGPTYSKQVFYDFETEQAVFTSDPDSWDLAFEAAPSGRHIFLNGGAPTVFVYNTSVKDMQAVTSLPVQPIQLSTTSDTGWKYDAPDNLPNGTAIGDWWAGGDTSNVIIVRAKDVAAIKTYVYKMRVLHCDDNGYTIEWAPLTGAAAPSRVQIPKVPGQNFVYFSFLKGITSPEPPNKTSWDIVFTQYRELIYDSEPSVQRAIPYTVTGALLNPTATLAADDSTDDFSVIDLPKAESLTMSDARNTIGYDWKTVNLSSSTATYTVKPKKNYVLSTQEGHLYKLHFLGFYDRSGNKGTPLFEYERLK